MYIQLNNYKIANEILYILKNVKDVECKPISKLGVQKLFYLSVALAPIKDIVMSILRFQRIYRGPYSKDIQNTLDNLVAYELIKITSFQILGKNNSIAYYEISKGGVFAVENLIRYNKEEEKHWWIRSVIMLSKLFSNHKILENDPEYNNLDKIVRLVYKDHSFMEKFDQHGAIIDFGDKLGKTAEIIEFTKSYISNHINQFKIYDDRALAELIMIAFFEQLLSNYIEDSILDERTR